ncbi:hypothetical protein D3C80_1859780 [compost metagenome]
MTTLRRRNPLAALPVAVVLLDDDLLFDVPFNDNALIAAAIVTWAIVVTALCLCGQRSGQNGSGKKRCKKFFHRDFLSVSMVRP